MTYLENITKSWNIVHFIFSCYGQYICQQIKTNILYQFGENDWNRNVVGSINIISKQHKMQRTSMADTRWAGGGEVNKHICFTLLLRDIY